MLFDLHPKESPQSLYARDEDLANIIQHISNGRWISILGPRMVGKTSLVKAARFKLEQKGFTTLYLNLWGCKSMTSLIESIIRALQSSSKLYNKMKKYIKEIDELKFGPIGVKIKKNARPVPLAQEILSILGNHSKNLLIILDEVQELSGVSPHLGRLLAQIFSTYSNIAFCFTGSQSGLVKSLHTPGPGSPLYGRSPAMLIISPFDSNTSKGFLKAGFGEYGIQALSQEVDEVVNRFGGIPGWLTFYGNHVVISKLSHKTALHRTEIEAFKTARQTLEHYLEGRNREEHIIALKAITIQSRWSQIRRALEAHLGKSINDGTIKNIVDALLSAFIIEKRDKNYHIVDPVIQRYLLSGNGI